MIKENDPLHRTPTSVALVIICTALGGALLLCYCFKSKTTAPLPQKVEAAP
jgi:hypothetical protein